MSRLNRILIVLSTLILIFGNSRVAAQSEVKEKPLIEIIKDLEKSTNYRFLYRESLISSISISLSEDLNTVEVFDELSDKLQNYKIGISVNSLREQVLIFKRPEDSEKKNVEISGYILDDKSGERLPFATIAWKENGLTNGIASNNSGYFFLNLETTSDSYTLLFSYVGYKAETITFDLTEKKQWQDLAIRLTPESLSSREIVINGVNFYTPRDTVYSGLVRNGVFNPLGESNSVRTLQLLPSVSTSTAINEGLNIRGSGSDGFIVQLDGITIYNQSHLFGLLDSFNSDVLQSSGFYYDITPAQVSAPLGGTLSLLTKTGSLNEFNGNAGVSNTSYRATLEGPIKPGRASFLLSGRFSYMDEVNWFNNSDLIEWGLDVNRPQSVVDNRFDFEDAGIRLGDYQANFYDLHGKLYLEAEDGGRFQISGYTGLDNAEQFYSRCVNTFTARPCLTTNDRNNNTFLDMDTKNRWGSNAITVQYQKAINNKTFSQSSIGFSSYDLDYNKDDFLFTANETNTNNFFLQPLIIENALNQFQINHTLDTVTDNLSLSAGIEYKFISVDYRENSVERLNILEQNDASQLDLFNQLDFTDNNFYTLFLGNRFHYFSNGSYLRWSPRYKLSLFPKNAVSVGIGFSRNYQFLNKIQFSNANTGDVWILANENEGPASVNQITSGIYFNVSPYTIFQVEGYFKNYDNIRLHELSTVFLNFNFQSETPFISQTKGIGKGLEFLLRSRNDKIDFTSTYTLSNIELENVVLNDGDPFNADWDRKHQLNSTLGYRISPFIEMNISYTYATGVPNSVFEIEDDLGRESADPRLPDYHRFDLSLNFEASENGRKVIEGNIFFFNLFDVQNVWYRDLRLLYQRQPLRLVAEPVDVYDLGFQPSFNVTLYF